MSKAKKTSKTERLPGPGIILWLWYVLLKVFGWTMATFAGPWKSYGDENVPREGPLILVANHQSYMDPIVIGWRAKRYFYAMGKRQLFETPILGWFFPRIGAFPVDQEGSPMPAIRAALQILKRGDAVAVFPEGKRTNGPMEKGQPGVALIARKSGAPIVPALIIGTHRMLSPVHPGFRGGPVTITFGKPFTLEGDAKTADLEADAQRIMEAIEALRAETPGAPPPLKAEDSAADPGVREQ
jgi:1-acyl-sn-glycerol-3-phosphate acyltransferase